MAADEKKWQAEWAITILTRALPSTWHPAFDLAPTDLCLGNSRPAECLARPLVCRLNQLEETLRTAIASRCRATQSVKQKLKQAFQAFDLDEKGYGLGGPLYERGLGGMPSKNTVTYREFCLALEWFGVYSSQTLRGVYDRYVTGDDLDTLDYLHFITQLYTDEKPWPPPPVRDVSDPQFFPVLSGAAPKKLSPSKDRMPARLLTPVDRVVSLGFANEAFRIQQPLKWTRDTPDGEWYQVLDTPKDPPPFHPAIPKD